jgi:hypothetical protein
MVKRAVLALTQVALEPSFSGIGSFAHGIPACPIGATTVGRVRADRLKLASTVIRHRDRGTPASRAVRAMTPRSRPGSVRPIVMATGAGKTGLTETV